MKHEILLLESSELISENDRESCLPDLIRRSGRAAENSWREFFEGTIANAHTRASYEIAVRQFLTWCEARGLELASIRAGDVGVYIRELPVSLPSKKVKLSALRRYFDLLVERHLVMLNPASSVRTERYSVDEGKTPEISADQIKVLLSSIDGSRLIGKRDHAAISIMVGTGCRVGAVAKLRRGDFVKSGSQYVLRFQEKRGKIRNIPVRHDLEVVLTEYIQAMGLVDAPDDAPLFPCGVRREKRFSNKSMSFHDMSRMVRRRMKEAKLPTGLSAHSLRVAVISDLLRQGIPIDTVKLLSGHTSDAIRLYDRSRREATRNLVERISFGE